MRRVLILAGLGAALLAPATAAAKPIRECGNPPGPARNLTVRGLTCKDGRYGVRVWEQGDVNPSLHLRERVRVRGCTTITDVRIWSARWVVRFQYYGNACDYTD